MKQWLYVLWVVSVLISGSSEAVIAQQTPVTSGQSASSQAQTQQPSVLQQPVKSQYTESAKEEQQLPSVRQFFTTTTKNPMEIWMTTLAAVVLIAVLIIFAFLGRKQPLGGEFQKSLLIVVIIFSAVILIAAGYTDAQIAPAFSLLGAIVGYLFGRTDWRSDRSATDNDLLPSGDQQNDKQNTSVNTKNTVPARNSAGADAEDRGIYPM